MPTWTAALKGRDLLSICDLAPAEVGYLVERGLDIKHRREQPELPGVNVALLFEKPSLRTRVSFEVAVSHMGGHPVDLSAERVGLGAREPLEDMAKVLSRYVDGLVVRTFTQATLQGLAYHATVPVINALSDDEHPCQALADLLTIREHVEALAGTSVAYVGDGNNVGTSLALAAASVGMHVRVASPAGYGLSPDVVSEVEHRAGATGGSLVLSQDPYTAVDGADAVYTDVWTSMGREAEAEQRRSAFASYQVNPELMARAAPRAIFLHPMPAHYGEEVPAGFLNHHQSVAYDQAENRLHAQKAVLAALFGR